MLIFLVLCQFDVGTEKEVWIEENGQLILKMNPFSYDAHSLKNHGPLFFIREKASFEQLPEFIEKSGDEKASYYIGMNEKNWKEYLIKSPD